MKSGTNHINSFFLEMILVILFFSVSVTVTAQLFVSAAARAGQSRDLSAALLQAQNLAEQVRGISSPDELPVMLSASSRQPKRGNSGVYRLEYDKNWRRTEKNPNFTVEVSLNKTGSGSGTLVEADIEVLRNQSGSASRLVSLHPAKYFPGTSQP